MDKALLFWILMLLALVFGGWGFKNANGNYGPYGMSFVVFLAVAVLGWATFGDPVK